MFGATQATKQQSSYATSADFCRIFSAEMDRLFLLSFLLTGDEAKAEKCFVGGLEDSTNASAVFKEWAQSWARRTIIQNAIRMIQPQPVQGDNSVEASRYAELHASAQQPEVSAVLALPAFERFVFVMSILEGYSVRNCSLLLGCTLAEVVAARTRALQTIGISAGLHQQWMENSQKLESDRKAGPATLNWLRTALVPQSSS